MNNVDIRMEIVAAGVKYYEVAEQMGIFPENLSRLFRHEMSIDKKNEVRAAINAIKSKKQ